MLVLRIEKIKSNDMNIIKIYSMLNNIKFIGINSIDADFYFNNIEDLNIFCNKFSEYNNYFNIDKLIWVPSNIKKTDDYNIFQIKNICNDLIIDNANKYIGVISFGGKINIEDIYNFWEEHNINSMPQIIIKNIGNQDNISISDNYTYENMINICNIGLLYPSSNLTIIIYLIENRVYNFEKHLEEILSETYLDSICMTYMTSSFFNIDENIKNIFSNYPNMNYCYKTSTNDLLYKTNINNVILPKDINYNYNIDENEIIFSGAIINISIIAALGLYNKKFEIKNKLEVETTIKTENNLIIQKSIKQDILVNNIANLIIKETSNINQNEISTKIYNLLQSVNNNSYNNIDNIFIDDNETESYNDLNESKLYKIPRNGLFTLHSLFNLKNINLQEITSNVEKPNIISVDHLGQLKALSRGKTQLKLYYNNKETNYNIEVYIPITSIKLKEKEINLRIGQKVKLNPIVEPKIEINNIAYESSNENIASVDIMGNITANASGNAEIKIYSIYNYTYCICKINVKYRIK
jgi:hypothetical protein